MNTEQETCPTDKAELRNWRRRQRYEELEAQKKGAYRALKAESSDARRYKLTDLSPNLNTTPPTIAPTPAIKVLDTPTNSNVNTQTHLPVTTPTASTPEESVKRLKGLALKFAKRQQAWANRRKVIQEWDGLCPWPSLRERWHLTNLLFHKVIPALTGTPYPECSQCKKQANLGWMWRITSKNDPLAFLAFKKADMTRVLRRPQDYLLMCHCCAWDLQLISFAWVFSPVNGRTATDTCKIAWGHLEHWNKLLPGQYPSSDAEIHRRINGGIIRSLNNKWMTPHGPQQGLFRWRSYHRWAAFTPYDIVWPELVEQLEKNALDKNHDAPGLRAPSESLHANT